MRALATSQALNKQLKKQGQATQEKQKSDTALQVH
jgi:hypothetical protein